MHYLPKKAYFEGRRRILGTQLVFKPASDHFTSDLMVSIVKIRRPLHIYNK